MTEGVGNPDKGRRYPGLVVDYDEHSGLGWVVDRAGRRLRFHCTEISDGSRVIPVGATVVFSVVPGRLGQWEAAAIEPEASGSPPLGA